MEKEKPITLKDLETMANGPAAQGKAVKLMTKNTPLDKHHRLLDRIIRSL